MQALEGRRSRIAIRAGLALVAAAMVAPAPLRAEPAPPFAILLRQAAGAPRLAESEAEIDRAGGLAAQARMRPNPTVSVFTENVTGGSPYRGFGRAETTLQVNQPFELGGKRSARIAAGAAGVTAARARDRDGRIAFAYDLARAYAAAETADRRIELAEDELEEAQSDLKAANGLYQAGKEARLRALQAESSTGATQADLAVAQANRIAAYERLTALAGSETPYTGLAESLLERTDLPVAANLDPLDTAPYLAAKAERDAVAARVTVERKRAIPDVTAMVGVRRLEVDNATAAVGGFSVPLHIFDRNHGNIAAAEAELRAADARLALARLDAQAAARSSGAQLAAADARMVAANVSQRIAEETYRLVRIAYEAGKSSLLELLTARHGLGAARAVGLEARVARLDARAMLARLQGRTIFGEPIQ